MSISSSHHIEQRLVLRSIPADLPRQVYEEAEERFLDTQTGYFVALASVFLAGREREMALVYEQKDDLVTLITMHPLKAGQKEARMAAGRWQRI